jgi:hypothetical protein
MVIIAIIKSEALSVLASPLSEIAYQLANTGAGAIDTQNTAVATAFGISGVDIVSTTPTDINTTFELDCQHLHQ